MSENKTNELHQSAQGDVLPPPTARAFCKYCGNELQIGSAFCPSCGRPQGSVPVQQPAAPLAQQPQQFVAQPVQQAQPVYQQPAPAAASNTTAQNTQNSNTTVVVQNSNPSNGVGTAGFVFALIALLVSWIPIVDVVVWFLGALLSFIGLFKKPRGLAIAGFIISFIGIIILVTVFGAILGLSSFSR